MGASIGDVLRPIAIGPGLGVLLLAATPGDGQAKDSGFPEILPYECSLENVAGVYGFNEDTLSTSASRRPSAFIGILELRPNGTAAIQVRGFYARGDDLRVGSTLEGAWSVEANCFGFIDFPEFPTPDGTTEVDYAFVAVENATELSLIRNNPLEKTDAKLLFRR